MVSRVKKKSANAECIPVVHLDKEKQYRKSSILYRVICGYKILNFCLSVQAAHPASTNTHVQLDVSTSTASHKMSQITSVRCNLHCWGLQPNMQNNNSILWLGATVNETFKEIQGVCPKPISTHKHRSGSNRLLHFPYWVSMLLSPLPLRNKTEFSPCLQISVCI